jgi:probable phage ssDNA binding protein|nr:MAG TPA: single-stranded DNA binding protein [Caudoviricetes sp.]
MDIQSFDFDKLASSQEQAFGEKKADFGDDRFYKLKRDENGNGAAIIRFLPDPNMKLMQQIFRINVNNQKGAERRWVSELSPQNINQPDPFHKAWADLWQAGKKEEARMFARQTRFYTNILVIKDPANPANEGKVFLLDLSQSLKLMLENAMFPSEADRALGAEPKALFNPLQGHNFKLVSSKAATGFITYEKSSVMDPVTSVFDSKEEAVTFIKENCYPLDDFLKPEAYKSYEELQQKLDYVLFRDAPATTTAAKPAGEVVDATGLTEAQLLHKEQSKDLDTFLDTI